MELRKDSHLYEGEKIMKTIIIYESTHHGNTRKVAEAISNKFDVELCDIKDSETLELEAYDLVGFASGVSFGGFYQDITRFAEENLKRCQNVFFLYTCAHDQGKFADTLEHMATEANCRVFGHFGCRGFNTYGPWKAIGGMNKKHPTEDELMQACHFYEKIVSECER